MKYFFKTIAFTLAFFILSKNNNTQLYATNNNNASQVLNDRSLMNRIKGFLLPVDSNALVSSSYQEDNETEKRLLAINRHTALLNITMQDENFDGSIKTICLNQNTTSVGFLAFFKEVIPTMDAVYRSYHKKPILFNIDLSNTNITDNVITQLFTLNSNATPQEQANVADLNRIFKEQVIKLTLSNSLTLAGYDNLLSRCSNIQTLRCHIYPSNKLLTIIARHCKNLKSLWLRECHKITNKGLSLLSSCKKLESINLHECMQINSVGLAGLANSCNNLKNASFSLSKIGNVGIRTLASRCPNLESLTLHQNQNITDIRPLHKCKKLTSLDLYSFQNNDDLLDQLPKLQQLKSLKIYINPITNRIIQKIALCKNLENLKINFKEINVQELTNLASLLPQLKSLDCSCGNITQNQIEILPLFTNLINLNLKNCDVTNDILNILQELNNLESLNLTNSNITVQGLQFLIPCKNLKHVSISLSETITRDALDTFNKQRTAIKLEPVTIRYSKSRYDDEE